MMTRFQLELVLVFSFFLLMSNSMAQSRFTLPIITDGAGVYLSASFVWESLKGSKQDELQKRQEITLLKRYINGARTGKSPKALLFPDDGSVDEFRGYDEFYRYIVDVQYESEVFWGGYIYVGLRYTLEPKNELFDWREDVYCGRQCYVSLDAGLNEKNQIFELIYALFLEQRAAVAKSGSPSRAYSDQLVETNRDIFPSILEQKNLVDKRYPLVLHLAMKWLDKDICWVNCKKGQSPSGSVTVSIASFMKKIHEEGADSILEDVLLEENDLNADSSVDVLLSRRGSLLRANIGLSQYLQYIEEWEKIHVIGYLSDHKYDYVFFIYKRHGSEGDGEFGSFRVDRVAEKIRFSPLSVFSNEILNRPEVLSMLADLWKKKKGLGSHSGVGK